MTILVNLKHLSRFGFIGENSKVLKGNDTFSESTDYHPCWKSNHPLAIANLKKKMEQGFKNVGSGSGQHGLEHLLVSDHCGELPLWAVF